MDFHPVASLFPIMTDSEIKTLAQDIAINGLRESIWLHQDGRIIDGRNRWLACERIGKQPGYRTWDGEGSLVAFVISLNLHRRHLNESQRAIVAAKIATLERGANQHRSIDLCSTQSEASELLNVSVPSIKRARHVLECGIPELIRAVEIGVMPVSMAASVADTPREVQYLIAEKVISGTKPREAVRQAKKEIMPESQPLPPRKYRVIYADPPWRYGDNRSELDGYSGSAAEDHFPTMSVEELSDLSIGEIAADNCVLFCWATFPLLPDALDVVKAWGFKYKTAFVWSKVRPNFGHYHRADAELLLVCTKGSCTPDEKKRDAQVQTIERTGKHSAKPEEFRQLIDRQYIDGPRIELFRRGEAPDGWAIWGNEAQ